MERRDDVKVKIGVQYDHLFPRAMLATITKKQGATVADTIKFIPQVVNDTLFHTEKIAQVLKRKTIYETCRAIWQFVYDHIAYKKDEDGKEQVRSPARTWHDRSNALGVDCDCYTTFISSILSNLKIKHVLRITKYKEDYFQHIYPIVPMNDGSYITIDCVVRNFDYEEPYSEKKDTKMDLEYLNGVSDSPKTTDAMDLIGIYDDKEAMAELGRLFKKKASTGSSGGGILKKLTSSIKPPPSSGDKKGLFKGKLKTIVKKTLHVVNRVNPATVLLRTGVLAAMKLNVMKVAQRLKYGYLSDGEAQKRGIDMAKFQRLKKVVEKLQSIFHGAGGKPENLKEAILTGKGNKNKDVAGLGYLPQNMDGMNEYTPISRLLGVDLYHSENIDGVYGLGELGEPATAATLAAASGAIGAIAALLKSIGNIFPKKDKSSGDFEERSGDGSGESVPGDAGDGSSGEGEYESESSSGNSQMALKTTGSSANREITSDGGSGDEGGDGSKPNFWENNKKWIKPVSIGIGALGLLYAGYRIVTPKKAASKASLSGVPKSRKKPRKKGGKKASIKSKKQKKQAVAFL